MHCDPVNSRWQHWTHYGSPVRVRRQVEGRSGIQSLLSVCSKSLYNSLSHDLYMNFSVFFSHKKIDPCNSSLFSQECNLQFIKEALKQERAQRNGDVYLILGSVLKNNHYAVHCIILHWGVSLHKYMCAVIMLQERVWWHTLKINSRSSHCVFIGHVQQSLSVFNWIRNYFCYSVFLRHAAIFSKYAICWWKVSTFTQVLYLSTILR